MQGLEAAQSITWIPLYIKLYFADLAGYHIAVIHMHICFINALSFTIMHFIRYGQLSYCIKPHTYLIGVKTLLRFQYLKLLRQAILCAWRLWHIQMIFACAAVSKEKTKPELYHLAIYYGRQ